MGTGIEEILEAIIKRIPPPQSPTDETLRALVFDSVFDVYRGVVGYVRVVSGTMEANHPIMLMSNHARHENQGGGRVYAEDACAGTAESW